MYINLMVALLTNINSFKMVLTKVVFVKNFLYDDKI